MTHVLRTSQLVARPIDEVFAFFSRPENLARLTPPSMGFERLSTDLEMRSGLEIDYRIRPLLGIPMRWRTRIDAYDPPRRFSDIQLSGPYRRWEHSHSFRAVDGGTLIEDELVYELPLGPLGAVAHRLRVRAELERIFRFRARAVAAIFATVEPNTSPLTVAVAGATGFVGGAIAAELHRRGHRVIALSHRGEAARGMLPDDVEIRQADVRDDAGLEAALSGVDALAISLAFRNSPIESPRRGQTFMAIDAAGTERLVRAAKAAGVRRLLYLSGAGAAPDARHHWFRAKARAERAVIGSEIPATIIRPTWIYGPGDVSLNRFIGFARMLPIVPLTNRGRQAMAPVFIADVANLAADALVDSAAIGQTFELGGPEAMSMRDVVARAIRMAGMPRPILPGPTALIKLGLEPLRLLPSPPLTPDAIDFINQPATADTQPLLARMPRRLTAFEDGLATYLAPDAGPGMISIDRPIAPPLANTATGTAPSR